MSRYAPTPTDCKCWRLPTSDHTAPLAWFHLHRAVQVKTTDGVLITGTYAGVHWVRTSTVVRPALEIVSVDGETVLLDFEQVALIDGHPLGGASPKDVAREVAATIEQEAVEPGDCRSWRVTVGHHEFVEVTIQRDNLDCQPASIPPDY